MLSATRECPAPIDSRLNVVVRSSTSFGLGRNGCWPFRGSQLPRTLPFIFSLCCPLNDRRRAAHSFFKIGRLFSLFLFSCAFLSLLRFLILLLLLMSGNVHPNPGPIFPCSVCTGNVIWRGKSVQCCACSKWLHLKCSQLSLSKFRALGSSHFCSCPPAESLWLPPRTPPTCIPPLCNLAPPLLTLLSRPTLVSKPLIPHLPIIYLLPLPPSPPFLAPCFPFAPPASTLPLTLSGFFNGMLEVFEPEALSYFTFFRPILLTLSAFRNPILTPLPLSGFLDSLLCVLIVPTPGLTFSLLIPCTLAAVSSFSSGRAYISLNFLPLLFLRSIPTLTMWGSTSLLTTPPRCHFLMCTPPYSLLPDGWQNRFLFSLHSFLLQQSLRSRGNINCHHHFWDSRGYF